MRLYVAGKMDGVHCHNFPAFDEARDQLIKAGYEVISPADIDRVWGFPGYGPVPAWCTRDFLLKHDLSAIDSVDGIALIDGWEFSDGVTVEFSYAKTTGKKINTLEGWLWKAKNDGS